MTCVEASRPFVRFFQPLRAPLPVFRPRLVLGAAGFLAGLGLVVARTSFVKAADDAGVLEFLLSASRASGGGSASPRSRAQRSISRAAAAVRRATLRAARSVVARHVARADQRLVAQRAAHVAQNRKPT